MRSTARIGQESDIGTTSAPVRRFPGEATLPIQMARLGRPDASRAARGCYNHLARAISAFLGSAARGFPPLYYFVGWDHPRTTSQQSSIMARMADSEIEQLRTASEELRLPLVPRPPNPPPGGYPPPSHRQPSGGLCRDCGITALPLPPLLPSPFIDVRASRLPSGSRTGPPIFYTGRPYCVWMAFSTKDSTKDRCICVYGVRRKHQGQPITGYGAYETGVFDCVWMAFSTKDSESPTPAPTLDPEQRGVTVLVVVVYQGHAQAYLSPNTIHTQIYLRLVLNTIHTQIVLPLVLNVINTQENSPVPEHHILESPALGAERHPQTHLYLNTKHAQKSLSLVLNTTYTQFNRLVIGVTHVRRLTDMSLVLKTIHTQILNIAP
ncbi:hypothetical protein Bbelb_257960 [Branchiostoma belcheri]|nr:hypothetical protein Bbelb_257960 [Branchiostoma belcheri]